MSNNVKKAGPFDVKTVESLVELMKQNDLSEIYLRDGNQHLRLRRGALLTANAPALLPTAPPASASTSHATDKPVSPTTDAAAAAQKNLIEIKSETVGTYFAHPKPGEPPYVKLGDKITPNKVVGLVEVMKTYNELQAGCSGVIVEILVKDSQSVEFGQVLFRVDPS